MGLGVWKILWGRFSFNSQIERIVNEKEKSRKTLHSAYSDCLINFLVDSLLPYMCLWRSHAAYTLILFENSYKWMMLNEGMNVSVVLLLFVLYCATDSVSLISHKRFSQSSHYPQCLHMYVQWGWFETEDDLKISSWNPTFSQAINIKKGSILGMRRKELRWQLFIKYEHEQSQRFN